MVRDRIEREVLLPFAIEQVCRMIREPDLLGAWLDAQVDVELRVGATGRFRLADGEERRVIVLEAGDEQLVFTWWRCDGHATTVTISMTRQGESTIARVSEQAAASARAVA
jgi:uncharacterized protein YndB with AHSA1/START domain